MTGAARAAARHRGAGRGDRAAARRTTRCGGGWARPGCARVARAVHRRADGRRDSGRVRARGRQTPRSGHCASACARLKPHAFIIPRWQSAKSYLTGSSGSSARSDAVMSRAIAPARARIARQPQTAADADDVGVERHDELGRRHARPDAEIERVAAHHPAQEQVQPLARAARPTAAERSSRRRAARHAPVGRPQIERQRTRREAVERRARRPRRAGRRPRGRTPSIDPARVDHLLQDPQQRDEVGARASSGGRCRRRPAPSRRGSNRRT